MRAGLILMMDRTFTRAPERDHRREGDPLGAARHRRHRHRRAAAGRRALRLPAGRADGRGAAREAGLGVTIHVGEEGGEIGSRGDRRGRSRRCGRTGSATGSSRPATQELMAALREREIVLEICPTSNLLTRALPDEDAVRDTFRTFVDARRRVHDRDRRPGDDADAPARRVRAAAPRRRARRGRAARGERARARVRLCPLVAGGRAGGASRWYSYGRPGGGCRWCRPPGSSCS